MQDEQATFQSMGYPLGYKPMLQITVKRGSPLRDGCDVLILPWWKNGKQNSLVVSELTRLLGPSFFQELEQCGFRGTIGEWMTLPTFGRIEGIPRIAVLGLGERACVTLDYLRQWGAHAHRHARILHAARMHCVLPRLGTSLRGPACAQAIAEGIWLGGYQFHAYHGTSHAEQTTGEVKEMQLWCEDQKDVASSTRAIKEASATIEGVLLARDLVNTPSAHMTPQRLTEIAQEIANRDARLSLTIMDRARMEELGMQGVLSVAQGSDHPPFGVHLVYRPSRKAKKRVVLVGKAVTFDSGGLSLKPADGMITMKCDMAGAAAVLGVFHALHTLAPSVEVHGLFFAVENMPSGRAYRPGDVVKALNGTTMEIVNTDAEGRVTLADALAYGETLEPDVMIDLATLTGACVVALGDDIAVVMTRGRDRSLSKRLREAADETGEPLWELPLYEPYQESIKSKIADLKNTGGRSAGAITAGLFLSHFVAKTPWAHLDIAGPAYREKESRPDLPYGGTGFGVRLLLRYLQGIA